MDDFLKMWKLNASKSVLELFVTKFDNCMLGILLLSNMIRLRGSSSLSFSKDKIVNFFFFYSDWLYNQKTLN